MGKVKVSAFSVTLDGFAAGPNQSLENPLGERGGEMMGWFFPTQFFQKMHGDGSANGTTGIDNDFAMRSFENVGAWILGRNMFGPVRGPWPDENWRGWWGENPPYHVPIFVLTHHARKPLEMQGDNTFYFITEGIEVALEKAKAAAKGKDIRIGGGAATVRQYLEKGLIDELHLAYSPVYLGRGENLLSGIDIAKLGYKVVEHTKGESALHVIIKKS